MSISEYFQRFHEEVDRNRTLFNEARALGQDARAKELIDELYELAFNHYQQMSEFRNHVQEKMAEHQNNPEVMKILSNLDQILGSYKQDSSAVLDKFVSETLGL